MPCRKSKKQIKRRERAQRSVKGKATTGKNIVKRTGGVLSQDISFKSLEIFMLKWNIGNLKTGSWYQNRKKMEKGKCLQNIV